MTYTDKRLAEFNETISNVMGICMIDSLRIKDFLIESIHQARAEERERIVGEVNRFTVYYRSKFSQDCSRDETEEDKSTEMIELADLLSSLDNPTDKE